MNSTAIRAAANAVATASVTAASASKPAAAHHLSGLQREVISLYRQCLREAGKKPTDTRDSFRKYTSTEFRKHAFTVSKKDFSTIEHLLRKGRRQLETLGNSSIRRLNM